MLDLKQLSDEVTIALQSVDVENDGEHLYSNYEYVTGILVRLTEIHNLLAMEEITGNGDTASKKFRVLIVDETISRLEKVAAYESRKITARSIEASLNN